MFKGIGEKEAEVTQSLQSVPACPTLQDAHAIPDSLPAQPALPSLPALASPQRSPSLPTVSASTSQRSHSLLPVSASTPQRSHSLPSVSACPTKKPSLSMLQATDAPLPAQPALPSLQAVPVHSYHQRSPTHSSTASSSSSDSFQTSSSSPENSLRNNSKTEWAFLTPPPQASQQKKKLSRKLKIKPKKIKSSTAEEVFGRKQPLINKFFASAANPARLLDDV